MSNITKLGKKVYWKLPMPASIKEKLRVRYTKRKFEKETDDKDVRCVNDQQVISDYTRSVLKRPTDVKEDYRDYEYHEPFKPSVDLIAYYLTQYSPDEHNDIWWGRGTTEWNNVSKAVPQFVGHRQPILPGELGFYDLRLKEVFERQIEIAKNYGISAFSFYYYWFAGERILEKPLNMFLADQSLDMPFMLCWANENWTRRFSGTDSSILIGMEHTEENYKDFIHEIMPYLGDKRYYKVKDRFVLQIYKPNLIPNLSSVIAYWRDEVFKAYGKKIYLIACQEGGKDWIKEGFDAENEWMQGSIRRQCKDITDHVKPIRKDFSGSVYDYADMVEHKKYIIDANRKRKVYPAIMPSWDNSARRNHRGTIWYHSEPALFKRWLKALISEVKERCDKHELDAPIIFVNAWNEWGEGAYMEPDKDYGFANLSAVWETLNE